MRLHQFTAALAALLLQVSSAVAGPLDVYRGAGRWVDDQDHAYSLDALHGRYTIITMAYGACRRICSTSLRMMEQAQALADARHQAMDFVVVGLDPTEDTPADWAAFRSARKLDRPNWHFLSGDEGSVARLANSLGVNYWRYGDHVMHDMRIVLLGPHGRALRHIDTFDEPVDELLP